jgi:integrase-like protein
LAIQSVYFNEIEDVLSSLDLLALVAPLVRKQPSYWKWVIIAAHTGLQGAMVYALRAQDTSGVSVLEKKSARKMLKRFDTQKGQPPEERLADFNTLLERCSDKKFMGGEPLKLTPLKMKTQPRRQPQKIGQLACAGRPTRRCDRGNTSSSLRSDASSKPTRPTGHGLRDSTMILIGYTHGLRVSELIGLQWSDVSFEDATLHIRRATGCLNQPST